MGEFETEAFTLLALAIVLIALRTYARWTSAGPTNFQLDDYLMPLAAVVYGLETGAAYSVGAKFLGLANNAMTTEQRASLDSNSEEYRLRVGGSKIQVAGWSLYTSLLWLLKTCMAIFYSRLTSGLINMTVRVRIAYVLIAVTYVTTILSILLGCYPMHRNWQINPDPGNHCQPAVSKIDIYVTVVLNVSTDMYLISIPAPMLWRAHLPLRRKLSLMVLFSGGIFVMMAGILRCVLILTAGANGAQQAGSWACRETFVSVVIGNVPMIYPLTRCILRKGGLLPSAYYGPSAGYLSSGQNTRERRRKKYHHPLSMPLDTKWGSEEQIVLQPHSQAGKSNAGRESESESHAEGIMVTREMTVQSTKHDEDRQSLGHKASTGSQGGEMQDIETGNAPRFVP